MASSQLRSFLATGVVLLTILGPSEGFLELVVGYFFSNFLWGAPSKIANRVSQAALEPAQSLLLGGGTEIVSQALTHDYIPGMRDFVWNAVGTSVSQLGSLAVSAIWWIISSIGSAIGTSLGAAIPAGVAAGNAVIAAIASIIAASVNGNILQNENDPAMQLQVVPQQRAAASRSFRSDAPLGECGRRPREGESRADSWLTAVDVVGVVRGGITCVNRCGLRRNDSATNHVS